MKKHKIHADASDLNYLYWVMFVFYVTAGTFSMAWFGDYYFEGAGKSDAAMFFLSAGVLLLGCADLWGSQSARKLARWSVFAINVVFFVLMFVSFGLSGFPFLYFLLLLILAAKCCLR